MTVAEKRDILIQLCKNRDAIKKDKSLVRSLIDSRLTFVPRKKLYKFRTCTDENFDILEENCIWMPPASEFPDLFDYTININPVENIKEIEQWLKGNYPVLCFDFAKGLYEERGIVVPYTHEDFKYYMENCLDENGDPIEEKERAFLIDHATPEELEHMDDIFQQLKELRDRFASHEDSAFKNISEAINQMRTALRNKSLVYCMTERYDNYTLWENYAQSYTGFCIEYSFQNFAEREFADYKNLVYIFPMTYRKKRPYFNLVPLMDGGFRQLVYKDDSWQRDPELDADLNMQLLYKNSDYEYEHEWRFSIKSENENKQRFPFVSALYAGKDMSDDHLKRLLQISKKLQVPVYRQIVNSAHNGFDYILVEEGKQ